jgi:protein TonB
VFFGFLLASAAAHATVLIALSPPTHEAAPFRANALEVVILEPKATAFDATGSASVSPASSKPEAREARTALEDTPQSKLASSVIALPEPRPDERRSIALGTGVREPAATASPEQASQTAAVPVTPPIFNAAYLQNPPPGYPEAARRAGEQGTVMLRVRVARDGIVSRVELDRSSGSPHLDAAAREAVKAWRFTPARRGAEAVESWMLVPIVFRLESSS